MHETHLRYFRTTTDEEHKQFLPITGAIDRSCAALLYKQSFMSHINLDRKKPCSLALASLLLVYFKYIARCF